MKVNRVIEVETNCFKIGDKIHVGKYTATCQKITPKSALFLLDQYITEIGDWQEAVQSQDVLNIFIDIRDQMIPFYNGELFHVPFGYGYVYQDATTFRPVFLISMKKEDATKKSAPENEDTIQDVLDTFNEKQRLLLYYIVGKAIEGEETILDVLVTLNDKQRLVLNYLVNKAAKDAKKGKTSNKSKKQ